MLNLEEAREKVKKYGQEHLLLSYDRLDESGREALLNQIENIDFEECEALFHLTKEKKCFESIKLEPLKVTDASKLSGEEVKKLILKGEKIIKEGKYAVVMMAGGQGTRLGHSGPKGTFDFGLESHKTIFEVLTDKLKEARDRLGITIPWYIMTSKDNDKQTIDFFEENDYFGYRGGIKTFFNQKELPMIDENGKLILDENGLVKEAANGHGGVYEALVESGALDEMKKMPQESFDFVFMDAAKAQYIYFLPEVVRLMKPGAVLVSDNVLQEGDLIESRFAVTRRDRTIHS